MLLLNATTIVKTSYADLVPSVELKEEGIALVYTRIDGELKVEPSNGVEGEVFAGFALSRNAPPQFIPHVESGIVPESGELLLARVPAAGQILVKVDGVIKTLTAAGATPADATKVDISGAIIRFDLGVAATKKAQYTVQYKYEPTVAEAAQLTGDQPIGGLAANTLDVTSFIEIGDVATNFFDASKDWSTVIHPNLGAGGNLTVGGDGTLLTNLIVKSVPNSDRAFLVVSAK